MSERTQQILWLVLAIIAIGLSAATVFLYIESRRVTPVTAGPFPRIAYVYFSNQDGRPQIYTCDVEGGDVTPLLESHTGDALPVCEPVPAGSGREPRIAFLRFETEPGSISSPEAGTPGGVYVVSSNGGEASKVSGKIPRILAVAPSWSSDGKELAFAGAEDLNADGKFADDEAGIYVSNVETFLATRVATVYATGLRLLWSPVGRQLILQTKKATVPVPVAHLLNLANGQLIARDDATTIGCWSPDGQHIAAYSVADHQIHVLRADGSEEYSIAAPTGHIIELLWVRTAMESSHDDGRFLTLSASQPNSSSGQLYTRAAVPGSGEAWKRLTDDETDAAYLAVSPDGRYLVYTLFTGHGPEPSPDLCLLEFGQNKPRRLTSDPGFEGMATWIPL